MKRPLKALQNSNMSLLWKLLHCEGQSEDSGPQFQSDIRARMKGLIRYEVPLGVKKLSRMAAPFFFFSISAQSPSMWSAALNRLDSHCAERSGGWVTDTLPVVASRGEWEDKTSYSEKLSTLDGKNDSTQNCCFVSIKLEKSKVFFKIVSEPR